jgi:hypothetical protein
VARGESSSRIMLFTALLLPTNQLLFLSLKKDLNRTVSGEQVHDQSHGLLTVATHQIIRLRKY